MRYRTRRNMTAVSTFLEGGRFGATYDSIENVPPGRQIATKVYGGGLISPTWDGDNWVEGADAQTVSFEKALLYEEGIIDRFKYLMLRALSSSMGKYGSYEYLQLQKEEYDLKYKVAKGLVNNPPIADAIAKEMERDFNDSVLSSVLTSYGITPAATQIEKMYQLIIFRYEYAETRYNNFKGFSIDFRTKCRTLVELQEWAKLDTAFEMVDTLPTELTDLQINTFYATFDAI